MENRRINGLENVPRSLRGCVLTMGNFDGVHRGHAEILAQAKRRGEQSDAPVVAMTFDPPPDLVLRPADPPRRLTETDRKVELLTECGADWALVVRSDRELLSLSAEAFVHRILTDRLSPTCVVEGENFFFGQGRSGTIQTLRGAGEEHGFTVQVVEPVVADLSEGASRISSTLIRGLILEGRVVDAAECLGRPFELIGPVIGGEGVGRLMDYPTANLDGGQQVVPSDGVYACRGRFAGRTYPAAVSIGCKPTRGPKPRTIEANLIGAEGDFYGQTLCVEFLQRLRGQEVFGTHKALRDQIAIDVAETERIVNG